MQTCAVGRERIVLVKTWTRGPSSRSPTEHLAATLGAMLRSPDPPTTAAPPRVLLAHEHRNRGPGDAPARWDANDETLRRFQAAAREHALRVEQLRAERVGTHQVSIIEVLREE